MRSRVAAYSHVIWLALRSSLLSHGPRVGRRIGSTLCRWHQVINRNTIVRCWGGCYKRSVDEALYTKQLFSWMYRCT
jgi:hypothetical protein